MNAGSWGMEIGDRLSTLMVMDRAGGIRWLQHAEVKFDYRGIDLPADEILLQGEFTLHKGKDAEIMGKMKDFVSRRKETQPLFQPSAGSIFKNPPDVPAGKLIEEAGFKGMRRGDAMVSPLHANFIVNVGTARAQDVMELITLIRERVFQESGTRLELEVQVIGEPEMET